MEANEVAVSGAEGITQSVTDVIVDSARRLVLRGNKILH